MIIAPKNWREFQHYKDRNPPWIRLQKSLLDDFEFHCLPVASRALAPMLWLIASDSLTGEISANPEKLAFRLRMTSVDLVAAIKPLIDSGFFVVIEDASELLAPCYQVAVPETETETEALQRTEAETEFAPAVKTTAIATRKKSEPKVETELQAACRETWARYVEAYFNRYGTEPIRNAKVNSAIKGFVQRVGHTEAPHIAEFYVSHNNAFYVRQCHDTGMLLKDSEKLRTEWATNTRVTNRAAQEADRMQGQSQMYANLAAKIERGEL